LSTVFNGSQQAEVSPAAKTFSKLSLVLSSTEPQWSVSLCYIPVLRLSLVDDGLTVEVAYRGAGMGCVVYLGSACLIDYVGDFFGGGE
jgi:hypothetical protein